MCEVPEDQGGCKCDANCQCIKKNECAKCEIPEDQGGCKCDANCQCIGSGGSSSILTQEQFDRVFSTKCATDDNAAKQYYSFGNLAKAMHDYGFATSPDEVRVDDRVAWLKDGWVG